MKQPPSPLRRDHAAIQRLYGDRRSPERLTAHYQVEIELAERLLGSTPEARARTYHEVYRDWLERVPDHPRRARKLDAARKDLVKTERLLRVFTKADDHAVEIGAGDGELARRMLAYCARITAIDVDDALAPAEPQPSNYAYMLADGVRLPLTDNTATFAYSNQLLEHIHPADTQTHLKEVQRVLSPGGRYLILTPNAVAGPHDVSRYFDDKARGTHLREFDAREIHACLMQAGFERIVFYVARGGFVFCPLPFPLARVIEKVFAMLPRALHTSVTRSKPARALLGLTVVAHKRSRPTLKSVGQA